MAKKSGGVPISPKKMAAQWKNAAHDFSINIWNFEVTLGQEAVNIFKGSFNKKRLNSVGSLRWQPRKDRKKHPILNETSTLQKSIEWKYIRAAGNLEGITIYTNPKKFGTAKRHKGFCYAAIHNDPSGTHTYGATGAPSVQRQFIGDSTALNDRIKKLTKMIFKGFPK